MAMTLNTQKRDDQSHAQEPSQEGEQTLVMLTRKDLLKWMVGGHAKDYRQEQPIKRPLTLDDIDGMSDQEAR
ncbi:hypothetical protein [Magnetofaba australis]|uniref:Uncharacterized protein n=1 Tax=Magnetofaba australis IT-1 TaxID=1434232 RepID=A0A1Y2JZG7_9PROT|nr:hypothetical protein [Magnetofaba australis]OSM00310.1 hypothetical protein MAIT1_00799 [Magnetofaba australis IT-1]